MTELTIVISVSVGVLALFTAGLRLSYEYLRNRKPSTKIKKKEVEKIIESTQKNINKLDKIMFIKNIETILNKINEEIIQKQYSQKIASKIEYLKDYIDNNLNLDGIRINFDELNYNIKLMSNLENLIDILNEIKNEI